KKGGEETHHRRRPQIHPRRCQSTYLKLEEEWRSKKRRLSKTRNLNGGSNPTSYLLGPTTYISSATTLEAS
ncbi:hypothetical protein LINPERHAP2_LOCUS14544, partial [Linum perenne]